MAMYSRRDVHFEEISRPGKAMSEEEYHQNEHHENVMSSAQQK